jgi:hypothetical protein
LGVVIFNAQKWAPILKSGFVLLLRQLKKGGKFSQKKICLTKMWIEIDVLVQILLKLKSQVPLPNKK